MIKLSEFVNSRFVYRFNRSSSKTKNKFRRKLLLINANFKSIDRRKLSMSSLSPTSSSNSRQKENSSSSTSNKTPNYNPNNYKYCYQWPRPSVTVDTVVFTVEENDVWILLIKRGNEPYINTWALPGGFVDPNENLELAALRELKEETNLDDLEIAQIGAYGNPGRDPRGHTVTIPYVAFLPSKGNSMKAGDDASDCRWFPLTRLPLNLAFDHEDIIKQGWGRLEVLAVGPEISIVERGSRKTLYETCEESKVETLRKVKNLM